MSHVAVFENGDEQPLLVKVDKALRMIQSMSSNHSVARWALSFLQKMLVYMHQTVRAQQSTSTTSVPDDSASVADVMALPATMNTEFDGARKLQALFGFAQGITGNLESQFQFLDSGLPELL